MPQFSKYPEESRGQFSSRMKRGGKGGGLVKAAGRFLQTAAQKDQKKGIVRNY